MKLEGLLVILVLVALFGPLGSQAVTKPLIHFLFKRKKAPRPPKLVKLIDPPPHYQINPHGYPEGGNHIHGTLETHSHSPHHGTYFSVYGPHQYNHQKPHTTQPYSPPGGTHFDYEPPGWDGADEYGNPHGEGHFDFENFGPFDEKGIHGGHVHGGHGGNKGTKVHGGFKVYEESRGYGGPKGNVGHNVHHTGHKNHRHHLHNVHGGSHYSNNFGHGVKHHNNIKYNPYKNGGLGGQVVHFVHKDHKRPVLYTVPHPPSKKPPPVYHYTPKHKYFQPSKPDNNEKGGFKPILRHPKKLHKYHYGPPKGHGTPFKPAVVKKPHKPVTFKVVKLPPKPLTFPVVKKPYKHKPVTFSAVSGPSNPKDLNDIMNEAIYREDYPRKENTNTKNRDRVNLTPAGVKGLDPATLEFIKEKIRFYTF